MAGHLRSTVRAVTAALVLGSAIAVVDPAPYAGAGGSGPSWELGDCFESIDLDGASLDLASSVDCSEEHAAQIIGGGPLPPALAALSREELIARAGSDPALDAFLEEVCGPVPLAANVYPKKQAKALIGLFDEYDVTDWIPAGAGSTSIVMSDQASFAAGATDVLCVFAPDVTFSGTTAGDVMRIPTSDVLEDVRICYVRNPGQGTDLSSCGEPHDLEGLIFLRQDVTGLPDSPTDWEGDDWAPFDEMCAEVGPVLVGAKRKDITFRANSQPDVAAVAGTRFVYCEALPVAEGKAFAGGTTVQGAGKKKLKFTDA